MKKFQYKAKKGPNELVEGTLLAETEDNAIDQVNEMGLLPIEITEEKTVAQITKEKPKKIVLLGRHRVHVRDLIIFYRQLSKLVQSGIPILRSIGLVRDQIENSYFKEILTRVETMVREGSPLSTALEQYEKVFPAFDTAMIQAGESVGKINETLSRIANYRQQQNALRAKVLTALAYPIFLAIAGVATVVFMVGYVIPKFSKFFLDLGQNLPAITRALIAVSGWVQQAWPFLFALVVGICFLVWRIRNSKVERRIFDRFVIRIPKVRTLIIQTEVARLTRTLELLLKNGMPILHAMKVAIPVVANDAIRQDLEKCSKTLVDGTYLSDGLKRSKFFPLFVSQLISIGEESGKLDDAFMEAANWYETELDESIKRITVLLEPAIILMIGLALGAIIVAVLLPVFSINALVQ